MTFWVAGWFVEEGAEEFLRPDKSDDVVGTDIWRLDGEFEDVTTTIEDYAIEITPFRVETRT